MALLFYKTLFTPSPNDHGGFLHGHSPLPADKLLLLQATCSNEEIARAIKEMNPSKAPGLDGFNAGFFHRTWPLTGPKVTAIVKRFMEGGEIPRGLGEVLLVLIPKVDHPVSMAQLRPISLCNVAYRAITKVITCRLRG